MRIHPLLLSMALLWSASPGRADDVRPPGKLVDLGGYRIHLWCTGPRSQKTIVLSSGAGGFAFDWALVQPVLARTHRVCSYDRPGYGFSDAGPNPRTIRQEAFELHAVLESARERPPYVLVGQSMGGMVVRMFARTHRDEVAGVVLVEAAHESARLGYHGQFVQVRTIASDRPVPPPHRLQESPPIFLAGDALEKCRSSAQSQSVYGPYLKLPEAEQKKVLWILHHPMCIESTYDYLPEEFADFFREHASNPHPLGSIPLIVLMGTSKAPPGVDPSEWRKEKLAEKSDLASLSTTGRLIIDPPSGHFLQIDNPALVIDSVRDVVGKAH